MVKTFLKIDRSTLPNDGQAIRFQTPNEEWFTGYFVEGDDLFWINESKWFNVWDVMCWVNDDPTHIVESRNNAAKSTTPEA